MRRKVGVSLDLVGGGLVALDFSIPQSFATNAGQSHQLSFFYGNNEELSAALATFTASIISGSETIWISATPPTRAIGVVQYYFCRRILHNHFRVFGHLTFFDRLRPIVRRRRKHAG
jgi:hypothetical protein